MEVFLSFIAAAGGIAIFVYGLNTVARATERLFDGTAGKVAAFCVNRPVTGFISGAVLAGVTQSSSAVTAAAVGLIEAGAATFIKVAPMITGANVGTTVTAQIAARTGGGDVFSTVAAGATSIAGVVLYFCTEHRISAAGEVCLGLGLTLFGLGEISSRAEVLSRATTVKTVLGCDEPLVLFFGALVVSGFTQSSSALTAVLILTSENSATAFYRAIFVIAGANVGSCVAASFAGVGKTEEARNTAVFNLVFNFFGAAVFVPSAIIFKDTILDVVADADVDAGRAMANFHTLFNFISALLAFPVLRPLCALTRKLTEITRRATEKFIKSTRNKTFIDKSRFIIDNSADKV